MRYTTLRHITVIIILSLSTYFNALSQKLLESRQSSYYTYIYKITEKEAHKVYKKSIWEVDSSFFHTLVDSFPTYNQYDRKLPKGHYLKTFAKKNKQQLSVTTVQDFDVFIFNNNTDLCIQVYDLKGNIINNAEVNVKSKKLRFNEKSQSYLDKKSNKKGLLSITHDGFTAYYDLSRKYNNSFIKRGMRKAIFGTPIKYAWLPVNYVISLPIDGAKSIKNGWSQGTIRSTKNFFVKAYHKMACLFDDYHCNYYSNNKFWDKHTGYMVFNKPKYLPGDTVKFKAFLVTKKGKAINKPMQVVLNNRGKEVILTKLLPYSNGGYQYEFYLHDSLQLQLDRNYTVSLMRNDRKEYIYDTFEYEDYELSKINFSLRAEAKEHYQGKTMTLYAKGTDENELNLMDARLEILLTPKQPEKYFTQHTFIPDTLLFLQKPLDPSGETEITLPDSAFPKANFDYTVHVRMLTSDNEAISKSELISYYFESDKFDINVKTDSIQFDYLKNGQPAPKEVTIYSEDNFGNKTEVYQGPTPCKISLTPYYASYTVSGDSISESVEMAGTPSLLQCFAERTQDSVYIKVNNPRKIPFVYNIYKRNGQKMYGYTDTLDIQQKTNTKQKYFVSLRYLWGGKVKEENYNIPFVDKKLNISVTQPQIVYPGQKSKIDILVTDVNGEPVEGVDLTAYSVTKKFGHSAPALPYLGKEKRNKALINNFSLKTPELKARNGLQLDYGAWKVLAGLDTIEYYKFTYPHDSIYHFEYQTKDSLTQFAPFVVSGGAIEPVHVIYVDNKPVYFSWSTHKQPYAFKVDSGFHYIKLRTAYREIEIDSMYFNQGQKLIFSIDQDSNNDGVKISKREPTLTSYEKRRLYKYIVPYRSNFKERFAYIEQEGNIQLLRSQPRNTRNNYAGPMVGDLSFHLMDSFSTQFTHEPFFQYEFSPEILKMRSVNRNRYPENLKIYKPSTSFTDTVLTKAIVNKLWQDYLDAKRYQKAHYLNPRSTKKGAGSLLIDFERGAHPIKDIPLNILVFRYDDHEFLRVYPGSTSLIHNLQKGHHKLLFFYTGSKYHIEDSVYIQPNGLNRYEFGQPSTFKQDSFSTYVSQLIEETLFKSNAGTYEEETTLKKIYHKYQQEFTYTGVGDIVEGYVYDSESGEPLPGVNVIVNGTTYGAVTDFDGYYSIKVPSGNDILSFSFVGFVAQEVPLIGHSGVLNISLNP